MMSTQVVGFKRSIAVIIGINDYANGVPCLTTAVNDAARLAAILQEKHGYEVTLVIEAATRGQLIKLFTKTLPAQVMPEDRLLFYFAGHGIALDGDDGPQGYLIPQDAKPEDPDTFLAMTDVHRWLAVLPCRHMLAILDCCFAGAFRWASLRHLQPLPPKLYIERYERFIRDPAWQVLTSAAYDQKALDMLNGNVVDARGVLEVNQQPHSPFALALFDALAGAGDVVPKGQGDGVITATELYVYLRDAVEGLAEEQAHYRQTPGLWPLNKHDKGEFIFLVPGHELNLEPAPPLTIENNPYRGLKAYEEEQADLFFGRAALVEKLAATVKQQPLTVVLGASGTGKSSVIKAGLLPYLRQKDHPAGQEVIPLEMSQAEQGWHILPPIRPGEAPLDTLTQTMTKLRATSMAEEAAVVEGVTITQSILADIEACLAAQPDQALLLVIDQFEELITLCRDDVQRVKFQITLADLLDHFPERLRLVLTLRTDFEPQFVESPLARHWQTGRFIVPPMSQAELRTVIEGPAAVRVLFFDPSALVDALIDEVIQTPGALPLLSFTLEQLYLKYLKRQEEAQKHGDTLERSLVWADYAELGGVIGSLRTRADEEYDRLPDAAHQATMQRVMLRMVAVEGGEIARRRVPLAELNYPNADENVRVALVLTRLVEARLLVRDSADDDGDGTADAYVEPAHDALMRAWDKLLVWKRGADEDLPLQRRLTQAANEWASAERKAKAGLLWNNNPRLGQLRQILTRKPANRKTNGWILNMQQTLWPKLTITNEPTWLNRRETEFVQISVNHRTSLLRRIVGITVAVIVVLTGLTIFAEINRRDANDQRDNAVNSQSTSVAESNARATQVIIRTTAEANAVTKEAEAVEAEATAIAERDLALSRQFSFASSARLTNGEDELALLLAIEGAKKSSTSEAFAAIRQAYDKTGRTIRRMQGHRDGVVDAVWAGADKYIVSSGCDIFEGTSCTLSSIKVWDVQTGRDVAVFEEGDYPALLPSPDGKYVIVYNYIPMLHKTKIAQNLSLIFLPLGSSDITWRSDSVAFLVPLNNGTVQVWDTNLLTHTLILSDPADSIQDATSFSTSKHRQVALWSPDNTVILTTNVISNSLRLWDAKTGAKLLELGEAQIGHFDDAAWTPDGSILTLDNKAGNVRIWNWRNSTIRLDLSGHVGIIRQTVWSPDTKQLATADQVGMIRIWDGQSGKLLTSFGSHSSYVYGLSWNQDGRKILTTGCDDGEPATESSSYCRQSSVLILDPKSGQLLAKLSGFQYVNAQWNPHSDHVLATGSTQSGSMTQVLDTEARKPQTIFNIKDQIDRVSWSANGNYILTIAQANLKIWVTQRVNEAFDQPSQGNRVIGAAPDKQGQRILVAECNALLTNENICSSTWIGLWDFEKESFLWSTTAPTSTVGIAWDKYDDHVLSIARDGQVSVWNATTGKELPALGFRIGSGSETMVRTAGLYVQAKPNEYDPDIAFRLYNFATGNEALRYKSGEWGYWLDINALYFDPSGKRLLVNACPTSSGKHGCTGFATQIIDVTNHHVFHELDIDESSWIKEGVWSAASLGDAAWSEDGKSLLTGGLDGMARLWDVDSGKQRLTLSSHLSEITNVSWNDNNRLILTVSKDGTARIWNARTGDLQAIHDFQTPLQFARWDYDKARLLAVGVDGSIHLYYTNITDLIDTVCQNTPRNMTWEEWQQFMGATEYRDTCPNVPTHETVINSKFNQVSQYLADGNIGGAIALLKQILKLEDTPSLRRMVARLLICDADRIASKSDTASLSKFKTMALEFDPSLKELSIEKLETICYSY